MVIIRSSFSWIPRILADKGKQTRLQMLSQCEDKLDAFWGPLKLLLMKVITLLTLETKTKTICKYGLFILADYICYLKIAPLKENTQRFTHLRLLSKSKQYWIMQSESFAASVTHIFNCSSSTVQFNSTLEVALHFLAENFNFIYFSISITLF